MRAIKFRAWNRIVKRYQYFNLKDIESQKEIIQWQNIEIEQFTGMKDRMGQDIYEGDILDHSEGNCKVVYNDDLASFEIHFTDGAGLSLWEATGFGRNELDVIGNICQNKELFK